MSYVFPKRELKDTDVVDPEGLNSDVMPAVEVLAGNLNEHNISANVKGIQPVSDGAYHKPYVSSRMVDPSLPDSRNDETHGRPYAYPGSHGKPYWIPKDNQWHVVGDGDVDEHRITITTGTGKVWVAGWLQYFFLPDHDYIKAPGSYMWPSSGGKPSTLSDWHPERLADRSYNGSYAANVRVGIRVDGRLVTETDTGRTDHRQRQDPFIPKHAMKAQSRGRRHPTNTHSLNPAAMPVRVGCIVDVGPGEHDIELVVRRSRYRSKDTGPDYFRHPTDARLLNPIVVVYNSQFAAIEIPEEPQGTSSGNVPSVKVFTSEESLTNEALYEERIKRLRDGVNDLTVDNLKRGALNHNHLTSPVLWAGQSEVIRDERRIITDSWPGYDKTSYVPDYGPVPGPATAARHPYFNGSGEYSYSEIASLALGDPTNGLDVHTNKCFLVVMANVALNKISTGQTEGSQNVLATFALGYKSVNPNTGTVTPGPDDIWFVPQETVCHATNCNVQDKTISDINGVFINKEMHADVPLMWIVDMTKRSPTWSKLNGYRTEPPTTTGGDLLNFKSLHLLASITPKGLEPLAPVLEDPHGSKYSTRNAWVAIDNCSISAFLLRF